MSTGSRAQQPPASLEDFVRKQFAPGDRTQRLARAQAALDEEERIQLSPEQWRWVAEDTDLEDSA